MAVCRNIFCSDRAISPGSGQLSMNCRPSCNLIMRLTEWNANSVLFSFALFVFRTKHRLRRRKGRIFLKWLKLLHKGVCVLWEYRFGVRAGEEQEKKATGLSRAAQFIRNVIWASSEGNDDSLVRLTVYNYRSLFMGFPTG